LQQRNDLRGGHPASRWATKFAFVINRKTVKTLGSLFIAGDVTE
jgi:hypothetical protein